MILNTDVLWGWIVSSSPGAVAVYCGGGTLTGTWAQTWAGTWAGPHKETIFNRPSGSQVNTTYYENQHFVLKPAQQILKCYPV